MWHKGRHGHEHPSAIIAGIGLAFGRPPAAPAPPATPTPTWRGGTHLRDLDIHEPARDGTIRTFVMARRTAVTAVAGNKHTLEFRLRRMVVPRPERIELV